MKTYLYDAARFVYAWFFRYPVVGAVAAIFIWIVSFGGVATLGMPDLFWRMSTNISFSAGLGVALVFELIVYVGFLIDADQLPGDEHWYAWRTYPLLMIFFAVGFIHEESDHKWAMALGWLVGFAALFVIVRVIDWVAKRLAPHIPKGKHVQRFLLQPTKRPELNIRALLIVILLLVAGVLFNVIHPAYNWIVAPFAIAMLLAFILLAYGWPYFQFPRQRLLFGAIFFLVMAIVNLVPFRYRYPALDALYAHPRKPSASFPDDLLLPDTLDAWANQFGGKPRLVVVATSGGGIRAAVWTSAVLRRLSNDPDFPDFVRHVRIITGASGGMVGAADFVATLDPAHPPQAVGAVEADVLDDVVRSLALRDSAKLVLPFSFPDRGVALERRWTSLDGTFTSIRDGEKAGWRPSLIFTPTMVEDGRRLIVSNLDLGDLGVPFFHIFPEVHRSMSLATAARMSASFPYVSPAAELPLDPRRHIVDAGYYDNYGIATAVAWITKNRDMIKEKTSGVALIQIRDCAVDSAVTNLDSPQKSNALRFFAELIAPPAGAVNAIFDSDVYRNDRAIAHCAALFDPGFLRTFKFENRADQQPLSWALTEKQRNEIHVRFDSKDVVAVRKQFAAWWSASSPQTDPLPHS